MERGIRLEVLRDVLNRSGEEAEQIARSMLKRKPTSGECLVHGFVKAYAKDESYSEYLKSCSNSSHLVGEVTVFVSHA